MLYDSSVPAIGAFIGPYRFLSNFWPAPTLYEGIVYPTSEHAYQAAKTTDRSMRLIIRDLSTPGRAKHAASMLPNLRPDWDEVRLGVMIQVVGAKFSAAGAMKIRERLLATWPAELVEGNGWHDRFWGVCGCNRCKGTGDNRLGKILMHLRLAGMNVKENTHG